MLILKAYVNNKQIDEIYIQNKGYCGGGRYIYKIINPDDNRKFLHKRNRGWKPLAVQVLKHLVTLDEMDETEEK